MRPKVKTGDMDGAFAHLAVAAKNGRDAVAFASDPNFYSVLVFDTAEQRDAALGILRTFGEAAGIRIAGARYLDGMAVMRGILEAAGLAGDIQLPTSPDKLTSPFKPANSLAELSMTFDEHEELQLPAEPRAIEFGTQESADDPLAGLEDLPTPDLDALLAPKESQWQEP